MAPRILDRLRAKVRAGHYLITFHAADEMDDDELTVFDLENIILTGEIVSRQRDPATRQPKYVLRGETVAQQAACCVVTVGLTDEVVFITVWVE